MEWWNDGMMEWWNGGRGVIVIPAIRCKMDSDVCEKQSIMR
jgi:hypothetical protein